MKRKLALAVDRALDWQYSRNRLRHWVTDGEIYKYNGGFHELIEIKSERQPGMIRQPGDLFRLLHKGKLIDRHRSVKVLKITAESL